MQFERLREIINRLVNRQQSERLEACWKTMPLSGEVVTLTVGPDQDFRVWRWSDQWLPCGTISCSVRHWNSELIGDFYRRDDQRASRLVWMPEMETPPEPAASLGASVERSIAVMYEADLSDALGFLLGKGLKPLWCEDAYPLDALRTDRQWGVDRGRDPRARRCVLVTSADDRRGCQWCV